MRNGYVINIEEATRQNPYFRRVLFTSPRMQLVLMTLAPGESIGEERHRAAQFMRFEEGQGYVDLGGERQAVGPGDAVVVPAGVRHDVACVGALPLRLYVIYSPPMHAPRALELRRSLLKKTGS